MSRRQIIDTSPRQRKNVAGARVVNKIEAQAHEHKWVNGPILEQEAVSHSPCSSADDHLWTWIIRVQDCECGETRRQVLGYKNRHRRGDDARIRNGLSPLGTPLLRSETYAKPRYFR